MGLNVNNYETSSQGTHMQQMGKNYMDDSSSQGSYMVKQDKNFDMMSNAGTEFGLNVRDDQSEASQMVRVDKQATNVFDDISS